MAARDFSVFAMDDRAGVIRPEEAVWFTLDDRLRPCVSVNEPSNFVPVARLRYTGNRVLVSTEPLVDLNMGSGHATYHTLAHARVPRRAAL